MSKNILHSILHFIQKETVLSIAAILAVISAFIVPPSASYIEYIDFRVLSLLFCLMLVVAGLQNIGFFQYLATRLLGKMKNTRQLTLALVAFCFFSSMFITNDVALITFVPFAVMILTMSGNEQLLIPVIVLQTIAANLGSMLTPIGNPQNLYLYSGYGISMGTFLLVMFPLTLCSAVLLMVSILLLKKHPITALPSQDNTTLEVKKLVLYLLLFIVCLACVILVLPWPVMLIILVIAIFFLDRTLFSKADYLLLLTFFCFFIFIGNIQSIPSVADLLQSFIKGRELPLCVLFSQGISNVPAAILLSGFTDDYKPLLYGINIGGLGTLIASLASVISFKLYGNCKNASKGKYIKYFTLYSIVFLVILYGVALLLL